MAKDNKTPFGGMEVSAKAIEDVAAEAALNCYGVVSLSHRNREGRGLQYLLDPKMFSKGVIANETRQGWNVDVYVIVAYGLKLTEIIGGVQEQVKYELEKTFDVKFRAINVYIQGVKVM
ncbi:MAG: Asp23/Gls24 family envelope stress response protein [Bacilli bacterium]|jgi:uncharacterized alkaline shock family protein YloU